MDLLIVTGASGSGKTTIAGPLAARLAGRCVTFDVDCVVAPAKQIAGSQPMAWDAFREAWLCIAGAVFRSGMPVVLLGPFIAEHLDDLPSRQRFATIHYLALDCEDELRRERIRARPFLQPDLEAQVDFGRHVRQIVPDQIDTGAIPPDETVAAVAEWVLALLVR